MFGGIKEMKNKILSSLILLALVVLLVTGCSGKIIKTDITKEYGTYLNYALGNYQIKDVKNTSDNGGGSGGFTSTNYKVWTIKYVDDLNNTEEIYLNNYAFNNSLQTAIKVLLQRELSQIPINKGNHSFDFSDHLIFINVDKIDETIKYYDSEKGVKISSLKLSNLTSNNIKPNISTHIYLNSEIEESELKLQLIEIFGKYYEYFDSKYLSIKFTIEKKQDNDRYDIIRTYTLKYNNGYTWE